MEKWHWCNELLIWSYRQLFWFCRVSLVKFRYWSKFHVNIITGSKVMTIFVDKGFTKNSEIGKNPVWVLSNIWRLGKIRNTKLSLIKNFRNTKLSLIKNYLMLQNARFTPFTSYELLRKNQLGGKNTHSPPRLGFKNRHHIQISG